MTGVRARSPWHIHRLRTIMEPDPADPREAEGVLNPAAARGPDGALYLLPRLVAAGNYSRIGLVRVVFDRRDAPVAVERLGMALEPREPYELNPRTGGGVEDPRVSYLAACGLYVMTYTAYGPAGPRVAAALSPDLRRWRRLGLVRFAAAPDLDLDALDDKDALPFPAAVVAPDGRAALALIHRPAAPALSPRRIPPAYGDRPGMWLSYAPLDEIRAGRPLVFGQHHPLVSPAHDWERLKVGGGTPPVRWGRDGDWLVLYHGVSGHIVAGVDQQRGVRYSAGILLLDGRDPRRVLYRSTHSLLAPRLTSERAGVVPQVVFPTGMDPRPDGALDVYYGMADTRIGVARLSYAALPAPVRDRAAHHEA